MICKEKQKSVPSFPKLLQQVFGRFQTTLPGTFEPHSNSFEQKKKKNTFRPVSESSLDSSRTLFRL